MRDIELQPRDYVLIWMLLSEKIDSDGVSDSLKQRCLGLQRKILNLEAKGRIAE